MTSRCDPEFWELYNGLPADVRQAADASFKRWMVNPKHPGLHFKLVEGTDDLWSVRIGKHYRALCIKDGENYQWFFIGSHADYDRLT